MFGHVSGTAPATRLTLFEKWKLRSSEMGNDLKPRKLGKDVKSCKLLVWTGVYLLTGNMHCILSQPQYLNKAPLLSSLRSIPYLPLEHFYKLKVNIAITVMFHINSSGVSGHPRSASYMQRRGLGGEDCIVGGEWSSAGAQAHLQMLNFH